MMGMESVPETLYFFNRLTRLVGREDKKKFFQGK